MDDDVDDATDDDDEEDEDDGCCDGDNGSACELVCVFFFVDGEIVDDADVCTVVDKPAV